jgi:predicted ArsR family transcriptional regulator
VKQVPGDGGRPATAPDWPRTRDELARLGEAFGDPTRLELYRQATDSGPLSAGEMAAVSGLHRTVVRTHLERLVELGLLEVTLRRTGRGGRPAKLYGRGGIPANVTIPARRYRHLARGLLAALPGVAGDETALLSAVEEAGAKEGAAVGASSLDEAVAWLNDGGYGAVVTNDEGRLMLELGNCVFSELAMASPAVVCAYDRALLRGLLGGFCDGLRPVSWIAGGDPVCRMTLEAAHPPGRRDRTA